MNLAYKGKGNKDSLKSHQPITVTCILYRISMQITKRQIEGWVETKGVLGELQNQFRKGRRLDDNLFVLTQGIEIAEKV